MRRRKRFHGNEFHEFFLMAIHKKGPLTLKELEEKSPMPLFIIFINLDIMFRKAYMISFSNFCQFSA